MELTTVLRMITGASNYCVYLL